MENFSRVTFLRLGSSEASDEALNIIAWPPGLAGFGAILESRHAFQEGCEHSTLIRLASWQLRWQFLPVLEL